MQTVPDPSISPHAVSSLCTPSSSDTKVFLRLIPETYEEQKSTDSASFRGKADYRERLRPRKIANYKDQFDISSSARSDTELEAEGSNLYTYGACVLPDSAKGLGDVIDRCDREIRDLETEFFDEEFKDSGTFSRSSFCS